MIANCPFCDKPLNISEVKTVGGKGTCTQKHCAVHGHIDSDIESLALKFERLKDILGRYNKSVKELVAPSIKKLIKEDFTPAEWEAIQGLIKDAD